MTLGITLGAWAYYRHGLGFVAWTAFFVAMLELLDLFWVSWTGMPMLVWMLT